MTIGDWTLTVTGTVTRVDRENVDKSGKKPRYMLSFVIAPETTDVPPGVKLPAELAIRIADRELTRFGPEPRPGERVTMAARGSGPNPATLYLTALSR